jgi:hypothetical protein
MTQEQKRIKLAEAGGWKCAEHVAEFDKPFALMCWHRPGNAEWQTEEPPDYFNDLNAVHELEKVLTNGQRRSYFYHLFGTQRLDDAELWKAVHATAAQRAEALGLTLNLWK